MKCGFKILPGILNSLLFILCSMLFSCKKTSNQPDTPQGLSYEYNGIIYHNKVTNGVSDWGLNFNNAHEAMGIILDMPDIFDGKIIFNAPNCAYLVPLADWEIHGPGCSIYTYGQPLDSSKIYFYKVGSFTSTKSNCRVKSGIDWVTGENYRYTLCDYNGTFSLTLEDRKGDIIEIKNGIFNATHQFE